MLRWWISVDLVILGRSLPLPLWLPECPLLRKPDQEEAILLRGLRGRKADQFGPVILVADVPGLYDLEQGVTSPQEAGKQAAQSQGNRARLKQYVAFPTLLRTNHRSKERLLAIRLGQVSSKKRRELRMQFIGLTCVCCMQLQFPAELSSIWKWCRNGPVPSSSKEVGISIAGVDIWF